MAFGFWRLAQIQVEHPEDLKVDDFMIDWLHDPADEINRLLNPDEAMLARLEERIKNTLLANTSQREPVKVPVNQGNAATKPGLVRKPKKRKDQQE